MSSLNERLSSLASQRIDFDHTAFAAPRIRDLLPLYHDVLGAEFVLGGDNPDAGWRVVRLALPLGPVIELMEPLRGSRFFSSFFRRSPKGGLHHVTFLVDDVVVAAHVLREAGYGATRPDDVVAVDRELFLHPSAASGTLVQLRERRGKTPDAIPSDETLADALAGHGMNGNGEPSP